MVGFLWKQGDKWGQLTIRDKVGVITNSRVSSDQSGWTFRDLWFWLIDYGIYRSGLKKSYLFV